MGNSEQDPVGDDRVRNGICTFAVIAALASAVAFAPVFSFAQDEAAEEPKSEIKTLPPAYDPQMMRLAEILGALHYLRELCKAGDALQWREQMEAMLEQEDPTAERRARLIGRFNRGFRGYREIYRECTPAAANAANRYLRQGTRLAAEIPGRFGS